MGVNLKRKRGPSAMEVVMVMVALVLLINTNSCGASFVVKSNVSSYRQCISSGAMDGCLIADDLDLDFDFFMDTHVVRILVQVPKTVTKHTGDPNHKVCPQPQKGQKYTCDPHTINPADSCKEKYKRTCSQPSM